jgi:hypothetical protein
MALNGIIFGRYVKFNVGGVPVTEDLQKALQVLDGECRYGSGGSWDIVKSGKTFKAIPVDGPFDSVKFNQKKNRWEEC